MNLHKKDHQFSFQIAELRTFILNLDERIARYEKIGRPTEQLEENRARAQHTLMQLKQAQTSKA